MLQAVSALEKKAGQGTLDCIDWCISKRTLKGDLREARDQRAGLWLSRVTAFPASLERSP